MLKFPMMQIWFKKKKKTEIVATIFKMCININTELNMAVATKSPQFVPFLSNGPFELRRRERE